MPATGKHKIIKIMEKTDELKMSVSLRIEIPKELHSKITEHQSRLMKKTGVFHSLMDAHVDLLKIATKRFNNSKKKLAS